MRRRSAMRETTVRFLLLLLCSRLAPAPAPAVVLVSFPRPGAQEREAPTRTGRKRPLSMSGPLVPHENLPTWNLADFNWMQLCAGETKARGDFADFGPSRFTELWRSLTEKEERGEKRKKRKKGSWERRKGIKVQRVMSYISFVFTFVFISSGSNRIKFE